MNASSRCGAGLLLALLSACAFDAAAPDISRPAAACAVASSINPAVQAPGIGGTGAVAASDPGGIGGTGRTAHEGSGIGGTGIVGVVTGFASVCVNGVEVDVQPDTPVARLGRDASLSDLSVGQVVVVRAQGTGTEVRAQRIEVMDAVVGPIEQIDAAEQVLRVLGQRVRVLAQADLVPLRVGDWVRVSGHRLSSGEVRASWVKATISGSPSEAQATGLLSPDGAGGWRLGGTPMVWPTGQGEPQPGQEWLAQGFWDGQHLRPLRLVLQPTRRAMGAAREVVLQGYVHSLRGRELQMGYEKVQLSDRLVVRGGDLGSLTAGQAVQVRGRLDELNRVLAVELSVGREGGRGARSSGEAGDDGTGRRGRNRGGDGESGSDGKGDSGGSSGNSGSSGSSGGSGSGSSGGQGRGRGRGG